MYQWSWEVENKLIFKPKKKKKKLNITIKLILIILTISESNILTIDFNKFLANSSIFSQIFFFIRLFLPIY